MDEVAQCIYRNDGVIWRSLSECTGEPYYESLGGFWLAEDNADENVTGPLLGTVYQMHYTLHQYSVQYAKYLQYLFCTSIWEKAHMQQPIPLISPFTWALMEVSCTERHWSKRPVDWIDWEETLNEWVRREEEGLIKGMWLCQLHITKEKCLLF